MEETDLTYHENMLPADTGLYCFKDAARSCGPDCMAFDKAPEHKDFVGKQWANCKLLVDSHRTGKHLVVLAEAVTVIRQHMDDLARMNQPLPPRPR